MNNLGDMGKSLKVWWHRDGKSFDFYVDTVDEAKMVIQVLTQHDLQDDTIGYNAGGLEEHTEADGWQEWMNDDGLDIMEVMYEDEQ